MRLVEQILIEWVDLCIGVDIRYVVMGGLAVRIYGIPRPTYDVDLTIAVDQRKLQQLFVDGKRIGYRVSEAYKNGWMDRVAEMPIVKLRTWLQDGKGIDVDLFVCEFAFQNALIDRGLECQFESRKLSVVSPEDLVLLKLLANRPRDIGVIHGQTPPARREEARVLCHPKARSPRRSHHPSGSSCIFISDDSRHSRATNSPGLAKFARQYRQLTRIKTHQRLLAP